MAMTLFLVDDNATFRENLKLFLEEHLGLKIVGEASSGREFLEKISVEVDIVLMDINMPDINGINATKAGTWENQSLRIIAVSQYNDMADMKQLIGAGFKGFVSKMNLFSDLPKAIDTVYKNGYYFPQEMMSENKIEE